VEEAAAGEQPENLGHTVPTLWASADGRASAIVFAARVCRLAEVTEVAEEAHWAAMVLAPADAEDLATAIEALPSVRQALPQAFLVLQGDCATGSAHVRWEAFERGANMVTADPSALSAAVGAVARHRAAAEAARAAGSPCHACAYCGLQLPSSALWEHLPLHHVHQPNRKSRCSICDRLVSNIQVHVHEDHVPPGYSAPEPEGDEAAICLVRGRGSGSEPWRYLLVHEFARLGFWTPGGRTQPGEDLRATAIRETREEAGIDVELRGLIHVEDTSHWLPGVSRRAMFLAEVQGPWGLGSGIPSPKSLPDFESAGAVWATLAELERLPLRAPEPLWLARHLEGGGPVLPMTALDERDGY